MSKKTEGYDNDFCNSVGVLHLIIKKSLFPMLFLFTNDHKTFIIF